MDELLLLPRRLLAGLLLLCLGYFACRYAPVGVAAGAAAVWVAKRRHAQLPLIHFFTRRPAVLTGVAFVTGQSALCSFKSLALVADGSVASAFGPALGYGLATVVGAGLAYRILGGTIMPTIFDLADDPKTLRAFIDQPSPSSQASSAPEGDFLSVDRLDQAEVFEALRSRVIGQDRILADLVPMAFRRASLRRKGKPLAVFMFAGATGAGKTELGKALADVMAEGRLVRVDGNEMVESQATQRLIGAPPGYIGSEQGGWLCRELARLRTGVLLIDEVEKAHTDVLKLIMGLLDEGRVTEQSTGRTYSAQGFLIVLTTNAEHQRIADVVHNVADPQERAAQVKDALQSVFRPEQLARIDEVYSFAELDRRAVVEIVGKFLLALAEDVGVTLASVDSALLIDLITRREKLKEYGVREVVRLVEKAVLDGMIEARAQGAQAVAIRLDREQVRVAPVLAESGATAGAHGRQ